MLSNYSQVLTVLYLYFQLSPWVVRLNLATRSMLQTAQTSISSGTIRASHLTMVKECATVTSSKHYSRIIIWMVPLGKPVTVSCLLSMS